MTFKPPPPSLPLLPFHLPLSVSAHDFITHSFLLHTEIRTIRQENRNQQTSISRPHWPILVSLHHFSSRPLVTQKPFYSCSLCSGSQWGPYTSSDSHSFLLFLYSFCMDSSPCCQICSIYYNMQWICVWLPSLHSSFWGKHPVCSPGGSCVMFLEMNLTRYCSHHPRTDSTWI